jgi:hypothetical protein
MSHRQWFSAVLLPSLLALAACGAGKAQSGSLDASSDTASGSGGSLEISGGRPTADGRTFGDLRAGGRLDSHEIISVEVVPYTHPFTYDVLPGSKTGTYFAGGALVGSTLEKP